jgi:hypothetical protein
MKQLLRTFSVLLLSVMSLTVVAQTYPNLAGTWYVNGDANIPARITQNVQYLTFSYSNLSSSGYFTTTSNQLYATEWKTYATLSPDGNTITWNNQYWTRATSSAYPDLSGKWYVNGDGAQPVQITQNGQNLNFSSGAGSSAGYFQSANQVYAKSWNTYANISSDRQTITWGNQTWTRKTTTSNQQGVNKRYCRFELSTFYYASQSLGAVWGRTGTEPVMPTAQAITAMQAHLDLARATLADYQTCIQNDLNKLSTLRSQLASMSSAQIRQSIETIIIELQTAITNAPWVCDNGVSPIAIYVGGVHLGAAQAWASAQQCRPAPMPAAIAGVIRGHLNTAQTALTPYTACLRGTRADGVTRILAFDFSVFGMVPLASPNSVEAHTFIVGIETQLLWAIALSDCCCSCTGRGTVTGGSACDTGCETYCKQKGFAHGRYNGKAPCLLGVVSDGGCDCY